MTNIIANASHKVKEHTVEEKSRLDIDFEKAQLENIELIVKLGCKGICWRLVPRGEKHGLLLNEKTKNYRADPRGPTLKKHLFTRLYYAHPEVDDLPYDLTKDEYGKSDLFMFAFPTKETLITEVGHFLPSLVRNEKVDILQVTCDHILVGRSKKQVVYLEETVTEIINVTEEFQTNYLTTAV